MKATHPRDVDALKRRLGPAFDELEQREDLGAHSPLERGELLEEWRAFEAAPADWLDAHHELERGKDLEGRLAWLQGPGPRLRRRTNTGPTHATGEIFGWHTVDELRDLLAAKSVEAAKITEAGNLAASTWGTADPAAYAAFDADLHAAGVAFERARSDAQGVIDAVPAAIAGATPILDDPGLLDAEGKPQNVWTELVNASKPYLALEARLSAAGHAPAPYAVLQPKATDVDLGAYKVADKGAQAIEAAAQTGLKYAIPIAIGVGLFVVVRAVRK